MNRLFLAVTLVLSTIACSHAKQARAPETAAAAPATTTPTAETCPLGIQGAKVAATDTADGAALNFTASPDKVDLLRQRVREVVAARQAGLREAQSMHGMPDTGADTGTPPAAPAPQPGETGTGSTAAAPVSPPMPGMEDMQGMPGMVQGPPGTATVEDTSDGVRVVLTPNEGVDPTRARSAVRLGAERMQNTPCGQAPTTR